MSSFESLETLKSLSQVLKLSTYFALTDLFQSPSIAITSLVWSWKETDNSKYKCSKVLKNISMRTREMWHQNVKSLQKLIYEDYSENTTLTRTQREK